MWSYTYILTINTSVYINPSNLTIFNIRWIVCVFWGEGARERVYIPVRGAHIYYFIRVCVSIRRCYSIKILVESIYNIVYYKFTICFSSCCRGQVQ